MATASPPISPRQQSTLYSRSRPHSTIVNGNRPLGVAVNGSRPQSDVYGIPRPKSTKGTSLSASRPHSVAYIGHGKGSSTLDSDVSTVASRIVVGVDFGTTYSGVAIIHSATPEDVDIIKTWPGANGITSDKVPTELSYEPAPSRLSKLGPMLSAPSTPPTPRSLTDTNNDEDGAPQARWGFQLKPDEPRLRCLKLFLDRNQLLPSYVSPLDTAALLKKHNRNIMDAVTDFLTYLYRHTMDTLSRRYGANFAMNTKVEFVLTVPAVWSDAAKNATLVAAERAGMGSRHELRLISEPEAAAVHTLKTFLPEFIRVGHNLIVCDAGGGTVDIIAYRVTQRSPLKIEESAVGTGSLCGSTFLNYRFEDHVRYRLGSDRYNDMRETKPKTWQMGLKYFEETVKRNFNDEEPQDFYIPFPGLADDDDIGLEGGFLSMAPAEVKEIFDPVVDEIIGLVEGQVNFIQAKEEIVSAVILVGGFGQSNYLYTRLKSYFSHVLPSPPDSARSSEDSQMAAMRPIEIMQPLHAWTAVVRGAVLRGLEGSPVVNRRSRWHYGTSYATVYDAAKHPIMDRYWSPLWERWMVSDRMQWHIAKGARVSERTAISFHYTRNFCWGQSLIVEDELIACDGDTAPDAYQQDLINVCTLSTDLSAVPKSLFTRLTTTNGVEFDNLDFTLDMIIDSASIVFELKVDGVSYGQVTADFH